MRILHTADWHLNDRLERQDRQPDLLRALDQISRYLDEYKVDVMVVAGDLFSERSTREQWRDAISQIKERFISFLTRGGTIVAISGNHDNEAYFDMLRDALDLASPRLRDFGPWPEFRCRLREQDSSARDVLGISLHMAGHGRHSCRRIVLVCTGRGKPFCVCKPRLAGSRRNHR